MNEKIIVCSNNKRQKINEREKVTKSDPNDDDTPTPPPPPPPPIILKDNDVMVVVFSFLHCCDVINASSTCKQWQRIYNSDGVQTKQFQDEIRWAKYAKRIITPQQIYHNDIESCGRNNIFVVDDGRILICQSSQFESSMDVYQYNKDCRFAQHKSTIDIPNPIMLHVISRKEYLLTRQLNPPELQLWKIDDDSKLKKVSCVEVEPLGDIRNIIMSPDIKVYYKTDTSIKVWDPMNKNKEKSSKVTDFVKGLQDRSINNSICCWKDLVMFGGNNLIYIWSATKKHEHLLRTIKPVDDKCEMIDRLGVQKIHNKDTLYVIIRNIFSERMSIFSMEDDWSLLCNIDDLSRFTQGHWFSRIPFFRNDLMLLSRTSRNGKGMIEIWKSNLQKYGRKIIFTLLDKVPIFEPQLDGGYTEYFGNIKFLPNGKIIMLDFYRRFHDDDDDDDVDESLVVHVWH